MTFGQTIFNYNNEPQSIREKNDKFDFVKIKNFCSEKDTLKRLKRQATNLGEKTFANPISDNGLIFRIHKDLSKLKTKKISQLNIFNGQMI